jgi:hypothetical protein
VSICLSHTHAGAGVGAEGIPAVAVLSQISLSHTCVNDQFLLTHTDVTSESDQIAHGSVANQTLNVLHSLPLSVIPLHISIRPTGS